MNIEMALKSRSYILDLDCIKLSLGIFFFLSCLIKSFFHQLSGSTFIIVKNRHQKAANLMFGLLLPVVKVPWCFLEGQCMSILTYSMVFKAYLSDIIVNLRCIRPLQSQSDPNYFLKTSVCADVSQHL